KDGQVTRGWIGVEPQELNAELVEAFKLKPEAARAGGVIITGVLQNGPAAKAGIRPGDVITAVDGQPVGNVSQLLTAVAALKPGTPSPLTVLRGDGQVEIPVTPGRRQRPKAAQR
ncbi:MAG: peptidase and chymotrypsin/Hap, partial [Polaromonas sp.]|nr:peptidase and chymotrypsin/Hap [Polaromonas sp.]